MVKSLKGKKLQDSITEEVIKYIEEQGFNQGDRLPPERFFYEQLQISRSTFREAMKKLESYGIIEIRPGSGMFLRSERTVLGELAKLKLGLSMDSKTIREMLDLRDLMEQYAIEKIIREGNSDCINKLSEIVDQYDRKIMNGEIPQHEDYMFHLTLYEGSANSFMLSLFQSVKEMELNLVKSFKEKEDNWNKHVVDKLDLAIYGRDTEPLHREIYEAMKRSDLKLAKQLMRKHFDILRHDRDKHNHEVLP